MIYGKVSLHELADLHDEMGLPEFFVFPWRQDGCLIGAVTGFIERGKHGERFLNVEHMIVVPDADRKFAVMMEMSECATQAAFANGCSYVRLCIFKNDPRRSGLQAWAKRLGYIQFADDEHSVFFVRYPTKEDRNGQERQSSEAAADSSPARSER